MCSLFLVAGGVARFKAAAAAARCSLLQMGSDASSRGRVSPRTGRCEDKLPPQKRPDSLSHVGAACHRCSCWKCESFSRSCQFSSAFLSRYHIWVRNGFEFSHILLKKLPSASFLRQSVFHWTNRGRLLFFLLTPRLQIQR